MTTLIHPPFLSTEGIHLFIRESELMFEFLRQSSASSLPNRAVEQQIKIAREGAAEGMPKPDKKDLESLK